MRRLLKMGRVFSCNLEKKGEDEKLNWTFGGANYPSNEWMSRKIINNVRKNRMGDPESEPRSLSPRARRAIFSSPFYVLSPLLFSPLFPLCARDFRDRSFEVHRQSLWCLPGLASHKRKWHFCVPVTNASRNNFVFFVDYLLRDSFPRRSFCPLSLSLLSQGRERVEGNKRIKKI